jgi:hypothetical protein
MIPAMASDLSSVSNLRNHHLPPSYATLYKKKERGCGGKHEMATNTWMTRSIGRTVARVPLGWSPCRLGLGGEGHGSSATSTPTASTADDRSPNYTGWLTLACRHCYRLGYTVRRAGPWIAHTITWGGCTGNSDDSPDMPIPRKPKWRQRTYARVTEQIEAGLVRLDMVFNIGSARLLDRLERSEQRRSRRR